MNTPNPNPTPKPAIPGAVLPDPKGGLPYVLVDEATLKEMFAKGKRVLKFRVPRR